MAAVRVHEQGHAEHGFRAASEAGDALRTLRARDCASLTQEINQQFSAAIDRGKAADEKYDADTRHGLLQGAVWPQRAKNQ